MNGRTNAKNGAGAIRDGCAVLEVRAPAYSQITATRADGLTKKQDKGYVDLSDTNYWFYYIIIQKFELSNLIWTVSATDGTDTASTAVSITTEGQCEIVTLEYRVYLFKAGDQCTDITGGWNISGWSYSGATVTAGTIASGKMSLGGANTLAALATDLAVPISGRTKLVAEVSGLSAVSTYASGVLEIYDSKGAISTPRDLAYALINNNTSHVLAEIDLTSITQTSVFVVTHVSGAVSTYQYEVYNVWLE